MSWFLLGFRRWADFGGRSVRREYIAFVYPIYALFVGGFLALDAVFAQNPPSWAVLAYFAGVLALLVPLWAVTIRRIHDLNLPGGILVLGGMLPGFNLVAMPLLSLIPGSNGENNYGDEAGLPSDYLGKI